MMSAFAYAPLLCLLPSRNSSKRLRDVGGHGMPLITSYTNDKRRTGFKNDFGPVRTHSCSPNMGVAGASVTHPCRPDVRDICVGISGFILHIPANLTGATEVFAYLPV